MTTQTQTLASFLLARIAEDEAVAERLRGGSVGDPWGWQPRNHPPETNDARRVQMTPARVLAECEAKRRIVEHLVAAGRGYDWMQATDAEIEADRERGVIGKLLALPYADHPDYRDEWRP